MMTDITSRYTICPTINAAVNTSQESHPAVQFFIDKYPIFLVISYDSYEDLLFVWAKNGYIDVLSAIADFEIRAISNINSYQATADTDDEDPKRTALMLAAENGHIEMSSCCCLIL